MDLDNHFQQTERLSTITQRIGFALWQLQELEWTIANYLVVRLHAKRGMGVQAGDELLRKVGERPFGSLLKEFSKSGILDPTLTERLITIRDARNWLVHRSRRESRGILGSHSKAESFIKRVDMISEEALVLLKQIGALMEKWIIGSGVSQDFINRESERLIAKWELLV